MQDRINTLLQQYARDREPIHLSLCLRVVTNLQCMHHGLERIDVRLDLVSACTRTQRQSSRYNEIFAMN